MMKIMLILTVCGVLIGSSTQGFAQSAGVPIDKIEDGSVYQKMGIKTGDVIKSINGTPVTSRKDVDDAFSKIEGGGKVRLEVLRAGQVQIFHMRAAKAEKAK